MDQISKKYRPQKFYDLIGQKENTQILKKIICDKVFGIPLLFTGPYGSGKTSISRIFSKAVLCNGLTEDQEPCDKCHSCLDFINGKNINYVEIDAASHGDVHTIRDLREEINYSAMGSQFKITNIDEAHNISKQGYNALLKQLEEGAKHHIFIFCTNEPEKMLHTVRSRCWRVHSQTITPEDLLINLNKISKLENITIETSALKLISEVQSPHIRDAQNTLDFLRYKGEIHKSDVENYFQIGDANLFLEFFIHMKTNFSKALDCLEKLTDSFDVDIIFKKILDIALICEGNRKGYDLKNSYYDPDLLNQAFKLDCDFLGISSFLIQVERPLDLHYLKCLFFELNRKLNNEPMPTYGESNKPKKNNFFNKIESDLEKTLLSTQIKKETKEETYQDLEEGSMKMNKIATENKEKDAFNANKYSKILSSEDVEDELS